MEMVRKLKYVGRILVGTDDDCPVICKNLSKVSNIWERTLVVFAREGSKMRISGMFYRVVVYSVVLIREKTLVISVHMLLGLEGGRMCFGWQIFGWRPMLIRETDG